MIKRQDSEMWHCLKDNLSGCQVNSKKSERAQHELQIL